MTSAVRHDCPARRRHGPARTVPRTRRAPVGQRTICGLLLGLATLAGAALAEHPSQAADWPQWRGRERDGRIAPGELPETWPEALARRWKVDVGEGHSSPVVVGELVYQHARSGEREVVACRDLATGRVRWSRDFPAPYEMHSAAAAHGKGPKSTPVVASGKLVTFGIAGQLRCFDALTGDPLWNRDFGETYPKTSPLYGTAMSPLIVGRTVVAHVGGHDRGALSAFDLESGQPRWSWDEDGPGYASPVVLEFGGVRQLATQSQRAVVALDPATGRLLWKHPFRTAYDQNSVTPVGAGDLLIVSGTQAGLQALRPRREGDRWILDPRWKVDELACYMSTPVVDGQEIYGLSERRKGLLFCADAATGKTHWTNAGRTGDHASVLVGDRFVLVVTTGGELLVVQRTPKAYVEVRRQKLTDSPVWAHPAVAHRSLLVKDARFLHCFDLK